MARISKNKDLFIFLLILITSQAFGQKQSLRFQHYTIDDGLPQNFVDCILQDSRGFMWFGTWGGLCRFDGYTFKDYRQQIKEYSTVSDNFIYALCEDYNGNIWIGTDDGLNIYDYNLDTFRVFNNDYPAYRMPDWKVTSIVQAKDSTIWIGTSKGLGTITIKTDSKVTGFEIYPFGKAATNVSGNIINHLLIDSRKNLWVSTDDGISILKKGENQFTYLKNNPSDFNSIPYNTVKSVYEDSKGNFWIATQYGLCQYNPADSIFYNFFHNPDLDFTLPHSYIMSVAEDAKGNIIVGTFGGLSIHKNDNSEFFTNYKENPFSEYSLSNDFINCIYKDRDGIIWIGTERGGINKFNSNKATFEYFEKEIGKKNTLSSNIINSILEDDFYIWIGTSGGGLNRYNKKTGIFQHYKYDSQGELPRFSNFISALHRDKNGNLWIGSWGGGLYRIINENTPDEKFLNYSPGNSGNFLVNSFVSSIVSDSSGNIWIGTYEGLDKYEIKSGKFIHISAGDNQPVLKRISSLIIDHANNLWVASEYGLYKIAIHENTGKYTVKYFSEDDGRDNGLSDNFLVSVYEDSQYNLWIGIYGIGLNKLESEDSGGIFTSITMEDGLPNNIIYGIVEDKMGNLWITTDYGLSRYNYSKNKIRNFYIADGLQNNVYYWNAAYINKDGRLYVGGMKGLNCFYPEMLVDETKSLNRVTITDLKIYNEPVKVGKKYGGRKVISQSIINNAEEIKISYKIKEIEFEFSSLNYEQPNSIKYAYILEGFDPDSYRDKWNEVSANRRYANYTNLKPGKYVFRIKSTDNNGDWIEASTDINLIIIPPFWATWWFRITFVLIVIALIVIYNKYRIFTLENQKKKLEQQVKERTAEIENQKEKLKIQNEQIHKQHDELFELNEKVISANEFKLKFFTNISHEFRTPLTLIIGPIERLLNNMPNREEIKKTLILLNKNAQRLLHLINQLMDFRKIEQGKVGLNISKANINEFLENIVQAFSPLAEQKEIALNFIPLQITGETWFDCQKIENILYNLLSNAFKFTPKGRDIVVKLGKSSINTSHTSIEVVVVGFAFLLIEQLGFILAAGNLGDVAENSFGTGIGLSLTKELVECHRGTISVKSRIGLGSTFIVDIPVRKECFDDSEITDKPYESSAIQKQVLHFTNELISDFPDLHTQNKPLKRVKGKPAILIVEDNKGLREYIAIKLNEKYNIMEAQNGKVAFELASSQNPDIIVSDIMMPEMDGLEFCRLIKTNLVTSHIPVILLTAKGEIEDEIEGLEYGADRYLLKPFRFELLEANISNLIESRRKLFKVFLLQKKLDTNILATTSTDEKFLQQIVKLIDDNIDNSGLSVNYLAEKMLISRGHLHKKLLSLANLSPIDFINAIRLKKSLELLHNPELNISEVAYSVGYTDPKYFSRLFRKHFGKSPSVFQEDFQLGK